mgnify:CR=1 FL=1
MINKIKIANYQSHKDTELELDSGVNVIIGESDSGKSAIVRAINWNSKNNPYRKRRGTKKKDFAEVTIEYDNCIVTRKRNDYENIYKINDEENDLKAFGTNVPQEIAEKINFSELNIQNQMDASFLLSKTDGEIGKFLNKIIKIDIIDTCLSNLERRKREGQKGLNNANETIDDLKDELSDYDCLEKYENIVNKLENDHKKYAVLKDKHATLDSVITKIKNLLTTFYDENSIIKLQSAVDSISKKQKNFVGLKNKYVELDSIITKIQECNKCIYNEDVTNEIQTEYNKLKLKSVERKELNEKITYLNRLVCDILDGKELCDENQSKIEFLKNKYREMMPNVCPLCGGKIK